MQAIAAFLLAARVLEISPVWSGHPVGFHLLTHGDQQFVAFYDDQRRMTVAARTLNSDRWQFVRLPSQLGWDSHNYVVMAVDRAGYLHLSGNMHVARLVYFRTTKPLAIDTFERVDAMVGANEDRCTYPQFLRGPAGALLFTYRDGRSGSGNQILNIYDEKTRTWRRLMKEPLTDGQGRMNAYFHGPVTGPDGSYHLCWVWRDSPDCATNHDLSYARSKDLEHWETSSGKPLALPIRIERAEIVDPVPVHGGVINGNTKIGFDSQRRPVITYHKFDAGGRTQIYNARLEQGRWRIYQTSDWDYRWEFQGGGAIPFEITHGAVTPQRDGTLRLEFRHPKRGAGAWRLDERTLKPVGETKLEKAEASVPGMKVHTAADSGQPSDGAWYVLRWETLEENRDRPRKAPLPPPSMLRLYRLEPE